MHPKPLRWVLRMFGITFQFPSNGKAHVHRDMDGYDVVIGDVLVSIPFKRESTCALKHIDLEATFVYGFNSLQTGKHMCTDVWNGFFPLSKEFQFPSNGKAHVHTSGISSSGTLALCFNSLQTGKHMCTRSFRNTLD